MAELAGVSVRTLHHYDAIGLLTPDGATTAGYRLYSEDNLATLQQVLFFRALGFSLQTIKQIIQDPSFDQRQALANHRRLLLEKRGQIDQLLATLDKTVKHMEGARRMSPQERFAGFDFTRNPYEEEARQRWGDAAVDQASSLIKGLPAAEQTVFGEAMNALFHKLSSLRDEPPTSSAAQAAIGEWFNLLNSISAYSREAFKNLGQMYVDDERFTRNIDQFGPGLAVFMRDAMAAFAERS